MLQSTLSLLFFLSSLLSLCDLPQAGIRQGYWSWYEQGPTDGTINWHQEHGWTQEEGELLPKNLESYAGVIAVLDCGLVGRDAWIRITDDRSDPEYRGKWLKVAIFDCSGHQSTSDWMLGFNVLGELGYYLVNKVGMYGQYNIEGEISLIPPEQNVQCGLVPMYDPAAVRAAWDRLTYVEDVNPPANKIPTLTIPQYLTLQPTETPTSTPTRTPTSTPTRTPTSIPSPSPTPIPTKEPETRAIVSNNESGPSNRSLVYLVLEANPVSTIIALLLYSTWTTSALLLFHIVIPIMDELATRRKRKRSRIKNGLDEAKIQD